MDTALLYGHPKGPPLKPSLKNLCKIYLGKTIQEGAHDSIEDADTAMKLAKLKLNYGLDFGHPILSDSG
jgi:RNA exonuclease 1